MWTQITPDVFIMDVYGVIIQIELKLKHIIVTKTENNQSWHLFYRNYNELRMVDDHLVYCDRVNKRLRITN